MVDKKTYGMTTYARLCEYLTPQPTECHTTIHQCSQPTHTSTHLVVVEGVVDLELICAAISTLALQVGWIAC
jgi:hypothetical protein